jgi:polar amino acid transport system permease protein
MHWDSVFTTDNIIRLMVGDLLWHGQMGGLLLTLVIGFTAIIASTILGAALGVMRASHLRVLRVPALLYIQTLRNVPLLILVFWAFFVPPYFGVKTSKFLSVTVALTLFTAAYIAEFVRGGIRGVPRGHREAARALGLSPLQLHLWVVLPQAF